MQIYVNVPLNMFNYTLIPNESDIGDLKKSKLGLSKLDMWYLKAKSTISTYANRDLHFNVKMGCYVSELACNIIKILLQLGALRGDI